MTSPKFTNTVKGVLAMVVCCLIWGLSPLFYASLNHVPPLDILAHRTLWSLVFFAGVLLLQGRLKTLVSLVTDRKKAGWIFVASLMISVNWCLFITSVQIGRVTESALGYYMLPLVSILFGLVIFREKLAFFQWIAVGLAVVAVLVLTLGLGAPPWISLGLAFSFGIYGAIKKRIPAGPVLSVAGEVFLLAPIALFWLWGVSNENAQGIQTILLLIISGPLTAAPLILFSYAAHHIRLASIGILQYLNPTLQFMVASLIFLEPVTQWHMIAFPLIWIALAIYSRAAWNQERQTLLKADTRSDTVGTV